MLFNTIYCQREKEKGIMKIKVMAIVSPSQLVFSNASPSSYIVDIKPKFLFTIKCAAKTKTKLDLLTLRIGGCVSQEKTPKSFAAPNNRVATSTEK